MQNSMYKTAFTDISWSVTGSNPMAID